MFFLGKTFFHVFPLLSTFRGNARGEGDTFECVSTRLCCCVRSRHETLLVNTCFSLLPLVFSLFFLLLKTHFFELAPLLFRFFNFALLLISLFFLLKRDFSNLTFFYHFRVFLFLDFVESFGIFVIVLVYLQFRI